MTQFDYVALDVAGREKRGRMPAANVEEVREKLVAKKLYVVSIGEGPERAAAGAPLLSIGPKRLSAKELTLFTRQLATLVRVSPIEESLRTIARQTESEKARGVIDTVHGGVLEGRSLAEAMQREAKSFPSFTGPWFQRAKAQARFLSSSIALLTCRSGRLRFGRSFLRRSPIRSFWRLSPCSLSGR